MKPSKDLKELKTLKGLKAEVAQELATRHATVPEAKAERYALLRRYLAGEKALEAVVLACMRQFPGEFTLHYSSSVEAVLDLMVVANPVMRLSFAQEAEATRKELAGEEAPSGLERLLIERIVACGLQVTHYERLYYRCLQKESARLAELSWMEGRIDGAHRRYLSSIKALAQVRRLQLPSLPSIQVALPGSTQVNVGEKQVNVAQAGAVQKNM